MYIGASCLRLVSYPPSSCIYLSHVKRGVAVHCDAIECNLATHPIGWWFSWKHTLMKEVLRKIAMTWLGIRIWRHQLWSWRWQVYLACCSQRWIIRPIIMKNPTDALALLSLLSSVYWWLWERMSTVKSPQWNKTARHCRAHAQSAVWHHYSSIDPGRKLMFTVGPQVLPTGSCCLWNQMGLLKLSQVFWK